MTDEGDLRRHPGFPVVPRVPRHISRVSGPGHHQLSVIGCAMVTVSSIAVTLWLSVTRASNDGMPRPHSMGDGTLRGSGGRWNDYRVPW